VEITREFVEAQIAELTREKEQHLVMANRFEGALIAMRMVLEELDRKEDENADSDERATEVQ